VNGFKKALSLALQINWSDSMAEQQKKFVTVDKIAEAFMISERAVQRLVIYEGMPRKNRGEYDLYKSLEWYVRHLQKQLCDSCDEPIHGGPCRVFDMQLRAERPKALARIVELAPSLVGETAESIRAILKRAIEDC
jgi:hypothetical protein